MIDIPTNIKIQISDKIYVKDPWTLLFRKIIKGIIQ
jgi:hypothetical protein